jgi:putative oxidoreductase
VILGKVFSPLKGAAPLLIRVVVGVVFVYHGADKVGLVGPDGFEASIKKAIGAAEHVGFRPSEFWGYMLAFTELIGGALLLVGFATRYAAASLAFVMAIAVFFAHGSAFSIEATPPGYEYALTLGVCCVSLLLTGGGPLALDGMWRKKD